MNRINDFLFQNALDLTETVVFEYDIANDVMNYSENVHKYMPCASSIASFISDLSIRGKILPEDIKKAISFFREGRDDTKLKIEHLRFMDFSGEYPWYQLRGKFVLDGKDSPTVCYGTLSLVDNQDSVDAFSEKSNRDPLTLLDSKETFIAKLNNYMSDLPEEVICNLIVVDIDDFKAYRAVNGDGNADAVLVEVSHIIQRALRGADIIGRYAGDEFMICMKGVTEEKMICERATYILDSIKNIIKDSQGKSVLSASVGVATVPDKRSLEVGDAPFNILYDKACVALESAKTGNKGSFVLYSDVLHQASEYKNIRITGRELDLVRTILDPISTWAYAVDEKYNLVYMNEALSDRLNIEGEGLCYAKLKGYTSPCPDCPLSKLYNSSDSIDCKVYSPSLRTTTNMRAASITLRNRSKVYILANVQEDLKEQIETLSDSSQRYFDAVMTMSSLVWDVNLTTNSCIRLHEEGFNVDGLDRVEKYNELRTYFLDNLVHPEDRELFLAVSEPERIRKSSTVGRNIIRKELRILSKDKGYRWYSLTAVSGQENKDEDEIVFISARDIDKLREETIEKFTIDEKYQAMMKNSKYQMEIALNNERYEHVNELTGIYVFEYDLSRQDYYVCTTFDTMFDVSDDMLKDEWSMLEGLVPYADDEDKYYNFVNLVKTEPDTHSTTLRLITTYGAPVWFTITVQTLKGLNNSLIRITGVLQNVNAEMEVKAELEFRADFDSVTGLYNSEHFYRATRERIYSLSHKNFAIISVDIRRFRIINDRFGIEAGNRCLKYLGEVIKKSLPWDGIAGHYQADVFSVLIEFEKDQDIFDYMSELTSNFRFEEAARCGSTLSFGIYKIHEKDIPVRLMCDRARFAKRDIKGNAFVNYAVYDDKLRLVMREQAEIESEMRLALSNHEFVMFLQPKYDANTEKICGAEALVRWKHPTKGLRMPGDFLPLFENNGFVRNLDEYMWEQAAIYLSELKKRGISIPISVNLSRIHIHNKDLLDILTNLVTKYDIDPKLLELEVTENYFMDDVNELYDCMLKLKEKGFILEMDDFGSGYSSLNMLRSAPVDVVKIDRFFLDEIMITKRGRIVVENSIRMSKQLGLTVVAEGVETRQQLEFVREAGCDIVQGYYYSKPIDLETFDKLLMEERNAVCKK